MRPLILILLAALALCAPPAGLADTASDELVRQVAEEVRRREGREATDEELVVELNVRTVALLEAGKYAEAESVARVALELGERTLGAEHPRTLASLKNQALLYELQGRYGDAEAPARRALAACERTLGAEHPQTVASLDSLAGVYQAQGRYGEAEPLYRGALAVNERTLGPEHPDTLTTLNNLAGLYDAQSRYGEAEPLYRRALAARERTLGVEHPHTLTSLGNLALLYQGQGRYADAEVLYRRALAAFDRTLGSEHPDTLWSLNNLALLYHAQGRYLEAEPLYRRAVAACERVLGAEHPHTLTSLSNLAALHQAQGRYLDAERIAHRTLEARKRTLGAEHPDTLTSLNNLACLYHARGRYLEAEPLYRRVLGASEGVLGPEHPQTIGTQLNLVATLVNASKLPEAIRHLRALDGRLRGFVGLQLATTGAEQVRRDRVNAEARLQNIVYTLALAHPDSDALPLAADILLRWKRLAGEEEAQVARLARLSLDPRVRDLAGLLAGARADLSRLANLPEPDPKPIAESRVELERLEVALATLSRTFAGQRAARALDWESVRDALPRGSALLELRAYHPFDFKTGEWSDPRWLALLIPADPGEGPPLRLYDLGPTAALAGPLAGLRQEDADAEGALYAGLFGPLDAAIRGFETLLLAPDGALDMVAFARLRLPDGRYWVERQALRVLRTGRDLLAPPPAREAAGMLVLGGVDYDRFPSTGPGAAAASGTPRPGDGLVADAAGLAGAPLLAMSRRLRAEGVRFGALPETGPESRAVGRYFWDYDGREALVLTGRDAAEGRLKALAEPPRVLHLATHGFFLPERDGAADADPRRPMTLGGVALAGANLGLEGQLGPDGQDGILYALEAQDLNLEGTALTVLSACDTGTGALDRSEGVYGLVRALQIAGSRDVLMTLWPLNDQLARAFMDDFYRTWLGAPTPMRPFEALRRTQLDWLGSEDEAKRDPRYWAPFVLVERG